MHELKILPEYFEAIKSGAKNFEIRLNDRDYKLHDELVLKEWDRGEYTGREIHRWVAYIYHGDGTYGIEAGTVVMALEPTNCVTCEHYHETEDDDGVHGHCNETSDLIRRSDAIGAGDAWLNKYSPYSSVHRNDMHDLINTIPSADAVSNTDIFKALQEAQETHEMLKKRVAEIEQLADRPMGEWIEKNTPIGIGYRFNKCGHIFNYRGNFCGNCGAVMKWGTE